MSTADVLALTATETRDLIEGASVELAARLGRPDITAATVKSAALELAARDHGGSRDDQYVILALGQIAEQVSGQLALSEPADEPEWTLGLTRADELHPDMAGRWVRDEVMRLCRDLNGRDGIRLAAPLVGEAYDEEYAEHCDDCTDDADAQVQRILKQYPHVFAGKNVAPGAQGSPGQVSDGWDDPTDHNAPKRGNVIHPEVDRYLRMQRNASGLDKPYGANGPNRGL
jgi:hypothetical protein